MRKAQILANIKENNGNSLDKSRTCEKHRIDWETIKTRSHRLSHMFVYAKSGRNRAWTKNDVFVQFSWVWTQMSRYLVVSIDSETFRVSYIVNVKEDNLTFSEWFLWTRPSHCLLFLFLLQVRCNNDSRTHAAEHIGELHATNALERMSAEYDGEIHATDFALDWITRMNLGIIGGTIAKTQGLRSITPQQRKLSWNHMQVHMQAIMN